MKWMKGPDSLEVTFLDDGPKGVERNVTRTSDCYITITADDFGIEVDRVAKMTIDEDAILLDGEIHGSRLLNRPVALFEVDKLNAAVEADQTCFLPDRYFYGVPNPGRKASYYQGREWLEHAATEIGNDVKAWRSPEQIEDFESCKRKFDLCPVVKQIIRRLVQEIKSEPGQNVTVRPPVGLDSEVFISYGRGDEQFAEQVFRYIRDHLKRKAFCNCAEVHHSHFRKEIENALERSDFFVSVGSSISNLRREWPTYECEVFHNDMLNGNKPATAQLLSFITGFDVRYLPLPQRLFQAIEFDPIDLKPALATLATYLNQ
jgi:hypothetical protein